MRVLIIHQNFPGQFRHVAKAWSERPGWQVVGIGRDTAPGMPALEQAGRLTLIRYKPHRSVQAAQDRGASVSNGALRYSAWSARFSHIGLGNMPS